MKETDRVALREKVDKLKKKANSWAACLARVFEVFPLICPNCKLELKPVAVILDVNLPSMHGWELARLLHRLVPKSKIIAFSLHSSAEYVVKMARCGARGYVTKDQPTSELLKAIKRVFQ